MTATSGFSSAATVTPDIGLAAGTEGNIVRSSRSLRPLLTTVGSGTNEIAKTAAADVRKPLTINKVDKKAVQACLVRGGWFRVETRITMVSKHNSGNTRMSGQNASLAQNEMGGGSWGATYVGASGARGTVSSSWVLTTILSILYAAG